MIKTVTTCIFFAIITATQYIALGQILASQNNIAFTSLSVNRYGGPTPYKRQTVNGISVPKEGTSTGPNDQADIPISKRSVKFGVGAGINTYLSNTYSYTLIAPSYSLDREKISSVSGVVSGVVIFNKSIYYYSKSMPDAEPYVKFYPLSAILAVNLAALTASTSSTATGFNTRLDLGIGVGYRLDDNFQIGLFIDFTSARFLRESYDQYKGKPIPAYATPTSTAAANLTALDITDDHYFVNHTVPSVSLKFIYNLTLDQPPAKAQQATKAAIAAGKFR